VVGGVVGMVHAMCAGRGQGDGQLGGHAVGGFAEQCGDRTEHGPVVEGQEGVPLVGAAERAGHPRGEVGRGESGGFDGALLRGAIANEKANTQLREFIESRLAEDARQSALDSHDAAVRVALAASMLVGIAVGRQIVQVAVLAEEETEAIVQRVGPALQAILVP
jgi:hypothetical protein